MNENIYVLGARYRTLLKCYVFFMLMFASTIASASTDQGNTITFTLLGLVFLLTVPVLIQSIRLHLAIKAVNPASASMGLSNAILSSLLFTPLEAAVVQPPFNLAIARKLLHLYRYDIGGGRE